MKLLIIPLVALGIVAGFALGRWTGTPAPDSKPAASAPAASAAPAPSTDPRDAELAALRAKTARQQEEVQALQKKLDEKTAPAKPADAPDSNALAEELWDLMKNFKKRSRGEDQLKAMKLIGDLKPAHAAFFAAKYREAKERDERHMALLGVSLSGGPEASNLLAGLLADPELEEESRSGILQALAGGHGMPNRLVLTDTLAQLGDRMIASEKENERAAAAGILGMKPRDARIEQQLRNMVETETSDSVKGAALMALARGGSPETLAWMKTMRDRGGENGSLKWELDQAIGELEHD